MPLRKVLIHLMLWSLVATAILGAYNALIGASTTGWRLVGTGVAAGMAAAIMLPFANRAGKPASRLDGLAGMTLTVILFGFMVPLIFGTFEAVGGYQIEERVAVSWWMLAVCGYVAVGLMRLIPKPAHRAAGILGVATCFVSLIVLWVSAWTGGAGVGSPHDKLLITGLCLGSFGLLATIALAGLDKRRPWRWAGVTAAMLSMLMAMVGIWDDATGHAGLFAAVVAIAAVIAHANLCLLVPLTPTQKWVPIPTILAALATALFIVLIFIAQDRQTQFLMAERLAAACGILTGCGTLALIVLAKLNRQLDRKPELSNITQLTLICPGCETKQTVGVGASVCTTCGLKFHIKVEEPRCPQCDYLLYKLQSDRCPECGFQLKNPPSVMPVPVQLV